MGKGILCPCACLRINRNPVGKGKKERVMRKRRNWLRTSIAMLTLVATVLETGFTSVSTLAAEIQTEDGIIVNNDAIEESNGGEDAFVEPDQGGEDSFVESSGSEENNDVSENEGELSIQVESSSDSDSGDAFVESGSSDEADSEESFVEENAANNEEEPVEEAEELKEGKLDVTDDGIKGSGYDEISIYVDTEKLSYRKSFKIEFFGPDSASYNTVINDKLYKTDNGRYDFENLEGNDFTVRATSDDKVILSYKYNEDGNPTIVVENEPVEKVLEKKTVSFESKDDVTAITGQGYESVKINFNTEELSDKTTFKLVVDTEAEAKVDGRSVSDGITGLDKDTRSVVIEELDDAEFTAYVVAEDEDLQIKSFADVENIEDGVATITVDSLSVKRFYEFEDNKIKVSATLEKADAVPDDAYFSVEPLTEEEAEEYLAVLNKDIDKETQEEYTAENTLLYDIGFYTDNTKSEEIEPEEGSVTLNVEFKQNQISEDLGVEEKKDIEVTHFIEEGNNIETEVLEVEQNGDVDTVEVSTDSFSKFAFKGSARKEINVKNPGSESVMGVVGSSAWQYGVTANTWYFNGESETNFAVKKLTGPDDNTPVNEGGQTGVTDKAAGSTHQYIKVQNVNGKTKIKGVSCTAIIPNGQNVNDWFINSTTGFLKAEYSDTIESDINGMISYVQGQSDRLAGLDSIENYTNLPAGDSANKLEINITNADSGTYYINVDKYPALKTALANNGCLSIRKKNDQKIVFNYTGTGDVRIDKFLVNGKDSVGMANMSTSMDKTVEDIFFNFQNAGKVHIQDAAGVFLAPKSTVTCGGVAGGWLICNIFKNGCEWHFLNGELPPPDDDNIGFTFSLDKRLVYKDNDNNEENDVDVPYELWPEEGFTFKLRKYLRDDPGDINSGIETDPNSIPDLETTSGQQLTKKRDAKGDYYEITLTRDNPTISLKSTKEYSASWVWNRTWGGNNYWADPNDSSIHYIAFMYKIEEVKGNAAGVTYDNAKPKYVKIFINAKNDSAQNKIYFLTPQIRNHYSVSVMGCIEGSPEFKNKLEVPKKINVPLHGIKKINGSEDNIPDGKFEFSLYNYTGSNTFNTLREKKENVGKNIDFSPIELEFGKGTKNTPTESFYYFLIKETRCDSPYTADPDGTFIAKVIVTKTASGELSPLVEYYQFKAGKTLNVTKAMNGDQGFKFGVGQFEYNNKFTATGHIDIGGVKFMEGRKLEEGEFNFALTEYEVDEATGEIKKDAEGNDIKKKDVSTTSNKAAEADGENKWKADFTFPTINYTQDDVGIHYYKVHEIKGTDPYIDYDSTIKTVKVEVKTQPNSKELDVKKVDPQAIEFKNKYTPPTGGIQFKAYKAAYSTKVSGTFTFVIEDLDDIVNGKPRELRRATASVGNRAVFDEFTFNDTDDGHTFHYQIRELCPPEVTAIDGVIYDERVYTVNVTVNDDKKGNLVPTVTGDLAAFYTGIDKNKLNIEAAAFNDPKEPIFVNDFVTPDPVEITINGEKKLTGKALSEGMFQFRLEDLNAESVRSNYTIAGTYDDTNKCYTVTNNNDHKFSFGPITFKAAGVYRFLVSENAQYKVLDDVVYTDNYYIVTCNVTDHNETTGVYYTKLKCDDPGDVTYEQYTPNPNDPDHPTHAASEKILFVNRTRVPGTAEIFASKLFNGQNPGNRKFTFYLMDENGNVLETQQNDENGTVTFNKRTYDLKDYNDNLDSSGKSVITYKIREDLEGATKADDGFYYKNGVKYDASEHIVTVTLTKTETDESGIVITPTVKYDDSDKIPEFKNEYKATGEYKLYGQKINGRDFVDDDAFSFYLYKAPNKPNYYSPDKPDQIANLVKGKKLGGILGYSNEGTFEFAPSESFTDFTFKYEYDEATDALTDQTTKPGEPYVFYLYEVGKGVGIQNDDNYFKIELTVTDPNKDGNLVVQDKITPISKTTGQAGTDFHTFVEGKYDGTTKVTFRNDKVGDGEIPFAANKKVVDAAGNTVDFGNKKFNFVLQDKEGNKIQDEDNEADGSVTFDSIKYKYEQISSSPFLYSIHENEQSDGFYTVDDNVFIAQVDLSVGTDKDDANKKVVVATRDYYTAVSEGASESSYDVAVNFKDGTKKYYKKGTKVDAAQVVFENTYVATGDVVLPATKVLNGRDIVAGEFAARLLDEKGNLLEEVDFPNVDEKGNKITDGKPVVINFPKIDYTLADLDGKETAKKYYTIEERIPSDAVDNYYKGVKYFDKKYSIVVTLTDEHNGHIDAKWVAYENGTVYTERSVWAKIADVLSGSNRDHDTTFVNEYDAKGKLELSAQKFLYGREWLDTDVFEFTLDKGDGNPVTKKTSDPDAILDTTKGTCTVSFGTIPYTLAELNKPDADHATAWKDYEYTIVEKNRGASLGGLKFSDSLYKISVTVTDNKEGRLEVTGSIVEMKPDENGKDIPVSTVTEFNLTDDNGVNSYKPDPVIFNNVNRPDDIQVVLGGKKSISGRPDLTENDVFSFKIKKAANGEVNKTFKEQIVKNKAGADKDSGKFTFAPIVYTAEDLAKTTDAYGNILEYEPYKVFKYEICELDPEGKEIDSTNPYVDKNTGITYDGTKYTYTVVVMFANGKLSTAVLEDDVDGDDFYINPDKYANVRRYPKTEGEGTGVIEITGRDTLEFHNTYNANGNVLIPAIKVFEGGDPEAEFKFELADNDKFANALSVIVKPGQKKYFVDHQFDGLSDAELRQKESEGELYTFKYDLKAKDTTPVYYMREVIPAKGSADYRPYCHYDDTVYRVEVTIADDGNGNLACTPAYKVGTQTNIPDENSTVYKYSLPEFVNIYEATGSTKIRGKKELHVNVDGVDTNILEYITGYDGFDQFSFELYNTDAAGNKTGDPIGVAPCDKTTGDFEFDLEKLGITYNLSDVGVPHRYKVVEVPPASFNATCKDGMKYDTNEYDVYVDVAQKTANGKVVADGTLDVSVSVPAMEIANADTYGTTRQITWLTKLKNLLTGNSEEESYDLLVINDYESTGLIDPPVLTKTLVGRELKPHEFRFHITASYEGTPEDLRTNGTLSLEKALTWQAQDYHIWNGVDKDGNLLDDKHAGELYVGDVNLTFADMLKAYKQDPKKHVNEKGELFDTYCYVAEEDPDVVEPGVTYSKAKIYLFVTAVDHKDGNIETIGNGEGGKLVWQTLEKDDEGNLVKGADGKYILREVQSDDLTLGFINKFISKTSVSLVGNKSLTGRQFTKDDIFEFTIKDVENYEKAEAAKKAGDTTADPSKFVYTVNNTMPTTGNEGEPYVIAFNADQPGLEFLNYTWGYKEVDPTAVNPDDRYEKVDESGYHTYRIDEVLGNMKGITYDKHYYIVKYYVEKDEKAKKLLDPQLVSVKKYEEDGTEVAFTPADGRLFTFENPFHAEAGIEFAGQKLIVDAADPGKTVSMGSLAGVYNFELLEYMGPGIGSVPIASATSDANGNFTVKPVKEGKTYLFDETDMRDENNKPVNEKTYSFTLQEKKPSVGQWVDGVFESNGVLYDNGYYMMKVNVHYVDRDTLVADVVSMDRHDEVGVVALGKDAASNLNFKYTFTNKVRENIERHGKKIWRDNVTVDTDHPPVTINLMRNGVKINSTTASAPDWTYSFTTDANGQPLAACDTKGRPYSYSVDEDPVPGYDSSVRINPDGSIDFINTKGDIKIRKIDAVTGAELEGARLAIYDGATQLEEWVSEIGPHVVTAKLTAGKTYTLRELAAPEGYDVAADVSFVAPSDGGEITVTMSDRPIVGSVRLVKRDAATRETLAGAEFALYTESGSRVYASGTTGTYSYSTTTSNGVFVVDATGTLSIADLPYGTYYFEETKAPEGYALSSERLGFSIVRGGELVEVTYYNAKALGAVRLRKVGSTGTGGLAGAVFELYAKTPRTVGQAASSTIFSDAYYRIGTYRSDSSGEIYVGDLPWDDYYFIEVDAPRGYELATDVNGDDLVYTFTISAINAGETIDLGSVVNFEEPPAPTPTPIGDRVRPGVLGERVKKGGVVNGVLGVRAKPTSGVLGERIGPVTGDASNIILWLLLLTACVATIVATIVTGKKKKNAAK